MASIGATQLLAFLTDGESAEAVRALMSRQNVSNVTVENGTATDAASFLKNNPSPHTLLVEISSAEAAAGQLDALADVVNPGTRVIVSGKVDTFSFYHWLMGLGIHDYLLQPFNEQQLASSLAKAAPGSASAAAAEQSNVVKKTIAVIGARGGVGTTTIATTLASLMAGPLETQTALIDLDPQFGSVALGLDLEPSRGLRDALEKPDRIDTLFLERVMMKPQPLLSILSAEEPLTELIHTQPQTGELLFKALREKFPMIVVDVPRQVSALTRYVLSTADHVLIVAEPSILGLRDTLRIRDLIVDTLKRPAPQIVVNREGYSKQEPSRAEFSKHLEMTPVAHIPFAAGVIGAGGRGDDVTKDAKLKHFNAPLRTLAEQFAGKEQAPDAKGDKKAKKGRK